MTQSAIKIAHRPSWVDLSSGNAAGSREFYSKLFGWQIDVNPDPQYGGYGRATLQGRDAAGITPTQSKDQPTTWNFYIATDDVDSTARAVKDAGGTVEMGPMDVGDQGRMAVFTDPVGAYISVWQPNRMGGFQTEGSNTFGWAELNARGIEKAIPFYEKVFGWTTKRSPVPGGPEYIEFQVDGDSVAGATEMNPKAAPSMPNHWLVYFDVDDVPAAYKKATGLGAREIVAPQSYPGGDFAIVADPQGAAFGLFKSTSRQR
jgi:predicted enzyme related to lactoylglutathione lyase